MLKGARSNFDRSKDFHKKYSPLIDEVPSLAFVSDDDFNLCFASIGEESTSILLKAFAGSAVLGTYTLDFENMNLVFFINTLKRHPQNTQGIGLEICFCKKL